MADDRQGLEAALETRLTAGLEQDAGKAAFTAPAFHIDVAELWLQPFSSRPAVSAHDRFDEVIYVLEGAASILVETAWMEVGKGSFLLIPALINHSVRNRTEMPLGLLTFFLPHGGDRKIADIVGFVVRERNEARRRGNTR